MRILVTGGTGFIGGRLVRRLIQDGHEVVCTVRNASRTDSLEKAGIQMVTANLLNEGSVEEVFSQVRPDAVFHCAASVMDTNESRLFEVNVESTRNVCKSCYMNSVDRLVYLSSVSVVSGNTDVPLGDDLPYDATSAYGRSKIEAEKVVMDFRKKGLKAAILRPCMVYGEGEPHALDKILRSISKRQIPILDTAEMDSRLNLVYVGNVSDALELALSRTEATEGTFMIADKEVITIRKFLEIIYDEMGKGYPPVIPVWVVNFLRWLPPVRKKMNRIFKDRVYDISRARDILGYDPQVSTEEGLRQTVRYWMTKKRTSGVAKGKSFDPSTV